MIFLFPFGCAFDIGGEDIKSIAVYGMRPALRLYHTDYGVDVTGFVQTKKSSSVEMPRFIGITA